jgi:hypothetical protein
MPRTTFHYREPHAPRPTAQTLGVTALMERDGKLLLERRRDTGQWGLVGGGVEIDELWELGFFTRDELADLDLVSTGGDILQAYLTREPLVLD